MKVFFTICLLIVFFPSFSQLADSARYFYQKGVEEKNARRWLVASTYFDRSIALDPAYTEAYIDNGYTNLEMRRMDQALASFKKAFELNPSNAAVVKALMELYYSYHQYQQAIDFAKKCTSCTNLEKTVAFCYYSLEDYVSAEKILLKLVSRTQADAEMLYTLGKCYMQMEMNAKAIPYFMKAVALDSTKSTWLFELGLLNYATDNYKTAVVYFNKAAEKGFPASNAFNENLGYAYIYSGDFARGEKILLDILAKKRGDKDILRDIAQIYYDRRLYDKSLEFCQRLIEMDLRDAKALYQAGLCFQMKGDKERGQQMCDRAIEMDPSLRGLKKKIETPGGL